MPTRIVDDGGSDASLAAIKPMLFVERDSPFDDADFTHELKFDGYRLLAEVSDGRVILKTRNGYDATPWFPEITTALADLRGDRHVLDGEVCVLDEHGRSDFNRLHRRARRRGHKAGADPVVFCVFDLLLHAGKDIRMQSLAKRKAALNRLLRKKRDSVLLVEGVPERGVWLYQQALDLELEGIVSKRLDSPYMSGVRSVDWIKIKRPGAVPAQRFDKGAPKDSA